MSRAGSYFFGAVIAVVVWAADSTIGHAAFDPVGFRIERFEDAARSRPILIDWWYPAALPAAGKDASVERGGVAPRPEKPSRYNYGLSEGAAIESASVLPGSRPLVLLSHGAQGAARNYAWIAEALAARGYLVAGVSHYGESYVYGANTVDPAAVLRISERPQDISAALSFALQKSVFSTRIDESRIGFLGHSSGGATGLLLAGVRFDQQRLGEYCRSVKSAADKGCDYADGVGHGAPATRGVSDDTVVSVDWSDPRIKAVAALDPALGPGFSDYSAVHPRLNLLLVGSVVNDFLPFAHHAMRIAMAWSAVPQTWPVQTHWLAGGEGHFVYLDVCHEHLSTQLQAGGVSLCLDRPGVSRIAVHRMLQERIAGFFGEALVSAEVLSPEDSR